MNPEPTRQPERPLKAAKTLSIGLLWHSLSSGNLGVGALTESHIAILTRLAESQGVRLAFHVLGPNVAGLPALEVELAARGHQMHCHVVRALKPQFARQIEQCDLVLDIGAGDSFATIYGFKRFFFYWLSKNRVCQAGVPLILSPQTIGPFDSLAARWMAKQVMRRCVKVFARDELSRTYLTELGMDAVSADATDVAFALPFERVDHGPTDKVRVGLNVSGLLFSGGYTGDNQFGLSIDYPATMRRLVKAFTDRPDVELHLVGHVIEPDRPVEDDTAAAKTLAAEFPRVRMAPIFTRPSEAKSYIAGLDFFSGARMHACIAALSSGVPVVPMAYSRKFNGLFGTLGYRRLADCKVDTADQVVDSILKGFDQREAVKLEVQAALVSVRERLKRYEDCVAAQVALLARRAA
jgi:polysaccharide pyruvyl transferase WcaK-like protein